MPRVATLALLLLLPDAPAQAPAPPAAAPAPSTWVVAAARMEGASVDVEEAAAAFAETARAVADGGRLARLAELRSDAHELNRKVVSIGLAARTLPTP